MPPTTARVTSKGQVTIPVQVRRALDIVPGDELHFELDESGVRLRVEVHKRTPLSDLYGALPATRPYPGTRAVRREVGRRLGAERDGGENGA